MKIRILLILLLIGSTHGRAEAGSLTVGVASNFTGAMKKIATAFTLETGVEIKTVFASTGKLYAMIEHGGPFDLFLAADTHRPALLHKKGLALKPFIYATGTAALWSNILELCSASSWQEALLKHGQGQVAIANPELAPYGKVTMEAISTPKSNLKYRLVYSQNVAQAFGFASKVTGIGFVATSMTRTEQGMKGCSWPLKEAKEVEQTACILKSSTKKENSTKFVSFLLSEKVKTILTDSGYRK